MTTETALDMAFARMEAAPADDSLRAEFYGVLADAELWVLLDREPGEDAIVPKLAQTDDGSFVLAFDREERLASFAQMTAAHAVLPARALVRMLAGQGIGLGVNIDVAPSETLLSADIVDWLAQVLDEAPETTQADPPVELLAPAGISPDLLAQLDKRLARVSGLARTALLTTARYRSGKEAVLLIITGADHSAEAAIAAGIADALRFESLEGVPPLEISFLLEGDPLAERAAKVAIRFDIPTPPQPEKPLRAAPGSDPDKPPILR